MRVLGSLNNMDLYLRYLLSQKKGPLKSKLRLPPLVAIQAFLLRIQSVSHATIGWYIYWLWQSIGILSALLVHYENHPFNTHFVSYERAKVNFANLTIIGSKEKIRFMILFCATLNTQRSFPNPYEGLSGFPHIPTLLYGCWKIIFIRAGCWKAK